MQALKMSSATKITNNKNIIKKNQSTNFTQNK